MTSEDDPFEGDPPGGQDPGAAASWRRLRELFDRAMEFDGSSRDAFVARACAGNVELRQALEVLLTNDRDADGFMDDPLILRAAASSMDAVTPTRMPERFGPYRVLRPVGQGGMSTVYLAVRDDETFQRRVVVKLLRADLHDADLERRLRMERTILSSLDHPNIARLLDGGATPDGRPYFVMEYVEGLPITAFADQHELTIDERLTLFRKVLGAVQYAHDNLIVHRDLKPSNILVAADGEPKLLDFGIAKLLNPELTADEIHATATWLRLMTPHYASPEQVRGKLVGMTSDVYSLGVLLYELLTGQLPFDLTGASPGDVERILTEHDPLKPSALVAGAESTAETVAARQRASSPPLLARQFAGDLDAITLKALRTAPQRRYASADRFADDVRRYQQDRPVRARQGSRRYRAGKWIRRHRTVSAVAVSLALALAVGAVALAVQHAEVVRERDVAERERGQRETVLDLLLDVLRVADPHLSAGDTFTVREALDSSAQALRSRLADEPALRAELLHTTGTIYHNLGLWTRARVDLEEALSLRRGLFGDEDPAIARTRGRLALVLANLGEIDEARRLSTRAIAGIDLARVGGRKRGTRRQALTLINDHVTVLCAAHEYPAAAQLSAKAVDLARQSQDHEALATALTNHAIVRLHHGEPAEAGEWLQQSVDLLAAMVGPDHPRLVYPLSNLGSSRRRAGDLDGALRAFERTLAIQQATLGDDHPTLARTLNNLAGVYAAHTNHRRALDTYRRAHEVFVRQAGVDHPRLLDLETKMAQEQIAAGAPAAAAAALRDSLERWRPRLGDDDRFVLSAELALGRALIALDQLRAAEPLLIAAFARILEGPQWERDSEAALDLLSALYTAAGTPERAEPFVARRAARAASESPG